MNMENDLYQLLKQWHDLLVSGAITEEEFDRKKKELLRDKEGIEVSPESTDQSSVGDNLTVEPDPIVTVSQDSPEKNFLPENQPVYPDWSENKTWFQKNLAWLIPISVLFLIGIGFLIYLKAFKPDQNIQTIKDFIAAEQSRDFNSIDSYFSPNMIRYWNLSYPTTEQLAKRYYHTWAVTPSSSNQIQEIDKTGDNTYDLHTQFSYTDKRGNYRSISSVVRFVFDNNGKITECYGVGE